MLRAIAIRHGNGKTLIQFLSFELTKETISDANSVTINLPIICYWFKLCRTSVLPSSKVNS